VIALLGLVGVALAQCEVTLPALAEGERWSGVFTVDDTDADCRRVDLGRVTHHSIGSIKGVIRQWDDGRERFGRERLVRVGEQWAVELPEWREGDRLKLKVSLEPADVGDLWFEPRTSLGRPNRVEVAWSVDGVPVFGSAGTVSLRTTQVWESVAGPGTFAVFSPVGAHVDECWSDSSSSSEGQPYGCVWSLKSGEGGSLSVSWVEDSVGLSSEWSLDDGQVLSMEGATFLSDAEPGPNGDFLGPGEVVIHLDQVGGVQVDPVALKEVEVAAKLVSIPEPGLGLRFKGRQLDDTLVRDILSLVQEQVQNGGRVGGHPLKARPLMDVRRSGWATPWEQALLLSRYLGQVKLNATAFPVRPTASGVAVTGAPEGYTHAVVHVEAGEHSFWLDPSCRSCAAGEITPGLWGGQVFSTRRDRMPEGSQSRR